MKIWSNSFTHNGPIPERCAFGKPNPHTHLELSDNLNPHLAWSELPDGTKSLVLICNDPDVPSVGTDANQEGKTIPAQLPRVDFCHWLLVDLTTTSAIEEGEFSNGIAVKGKGGPAAARDTRQGVNDFTRWFASDPNMGGDYYGYDGPCPPWNDELLHHYHFTLYALDIPRCPLEGRFTVTELTRAINGHILDQATLIGTYSLNPDIR